MSSNGDALAPPGASLAAAASSDTERTPLLSPSPRPSYRQRALSRASGNPLPLAPSSSDPDEALSAQRALTLRRRLKTALLAVLAFLLVSGIVLAIVLPLTIGRRGKGGGGGGGGGKKGDTPDFTKLPEPKPGGRNPSYLVSGWEGAVASEEGRCSQIGVDVAAPWRLSVD
ncbi:hypothetical protein JCM5296_007002 [Sporobolomyces johnsonii]